MCGGLDIKEVWTDVCVCGNNIRGSADKMNMRVGWISSYCGWAGYPDSGQDECVGGLAIQVVWAR